MKANEVRVFWFEPTRHDQRGFPVLDKLCVTVKASPRQMALPGALVGSFPDGFTVEPSLRTRRRQRLRAHRARGDVT